MILILSEEYDYSTSIVMDWLYYWGKDVVRISNNDKIIVQKILLKNDANTDFCLKVKGFEFCLSSIECFWYRRGEICIETFEFDKSALDNFSSIKSQLNLELNAIKEFLYFSLTRIRHLSSILTSRPNKLIQLKYASELELEIPTTLLSSKKESIQEFLGQSRKCITKSIYESPYINIDRSTNLIGYTSEITFDVINCLPEFSFPSMLQQKIEKLFELRIFFLNKKFFTMAIFSQLDDKTAVDFRKYDFKKTSRSIPYELPVIIKMKLCKLMKKLNLKTGSIDMVYTKENTYVFLEVNPIGQFGMTSQPCNFNLELEIAKFLCNEN